MQGLPRKHGAIVNMMRTVTCLDTFQTALVRLLNDLLISKDYILAQTLLTSYLDPQVKVKHVKIMA